MSSVKVRSVLAGIDLFSTLDDDALSQIEQSGTTFTTGAGGKVIAEGSSDSGLRILLDGSAAVDVGGESRGEVNAGDYVGEISAIDGEPRSASLTAGPDGCTTFAISSLQLTPLVRSNPDIAVALLKTLSARLRKVEAAAAKS
ncbi:Crp/Fnr family transcriptional regulator [Luteipulveratus mongoliensis]|uniref:Crp/Fnr family transcriptional regulator n=1 Tax=Luteipulveratus mongoliensis TaxID=571913 RepID=UPI00069657C4|nr:cyclic nucleotide-binding domain-containing protein [Luteipulveratus mongoliensis]